MSVVYQILGDLITKDMRLDPICVRSDLSGPQARNDIRDHEIGSRMATIDMITLFLTSALAAGFCSDARCG